MERHARQARLAGIGADGQARIARASVEVGLDGPAGDVAVRYLAGAGVGCLQVASEDLATLARAIDTSLRVEVRPDLEAPTTQPLALDDPSAVALARGAMLALRALRRSVQEEP